MSSPTFPTLTTLRAAVDQARIDASGQRDADGTMDGAAVLARRSQHRAEMMSAELQAQLHAQPQALATAQAVASTLPSDGSVPPGSLLNLSA